MKRVVFMGSDDFSVPILQVLLDSGAALAAPVTVVGVVTQPDKASGRGRHIRFGPVKETALSRNIPVLQLRRLRDADSSSEVLALRPDVIVVAAYGQLLPPAILAAPPHGCLNLHPSLLPKYRGPSPVAGAILAGETTTGTSLMLMEAAMDAGPIISQESTAMGPDETAGDLERRLAVASAELLCRDLPEWITGRMRACPQDGVVATYTRRISRVDARLDWTLPATNLALQVRAYNPWPGAHAVWGEREVRMLNASAVEGRGEPGTVLGLRSGALEVATGHGVLAVDRLQLAGGKPLDAGSVVRGHPFLLDARLA